jgi:hypothetical protein
MGQEELVAAAFRARFKTPASMIETMGLDADILKGPAMPELSLTAAVAKGALLAILAKRMAPGKRANELALDEILKDVTKENWTPEKRKQVAERVQRKFAPVLAMDADLNDVPGTLSNLPPNSAPPLKPATDQSPEQIMAWLSANCPPEMLAKMKSDLGIEHVGEPIAAPGAPEVPPAPAAPGPPKNADQDPMAAAPPPPAAVPPAAPLPATDEDDEEENGAMDKTAMDAAIQKERQNQRAIYGAVEHVRAKVGNLSVLAFDSSAEVYRQALGMLGVPTEGLHETALKPVFDAQPLPGSKSPSPRPNLKLASDSNAPAVPSASEAFPDLLRITNG